MEKRIYSGVQAYNTIRENIIFCKYTPGEFLNETFLSEQLGVSRTPIREALNRLEQENLVKIFPKRGVQVTEISIVDINEIYQVRELIEPYIVSLYGKDVDKSLLLNIRKQLQISYDNPQDTAPYRVDNDLHKAILSANRNRYFAITLENVYAQNHRVRILTGRCTANRLAETNQEHINIIDAMLIDEYEMGAKAMQAHLQASKRAAISSMLN